jgi:hypothetical protein
VFEDRLTCNKVKSVSFLVGTLSPIMSVEDGKDLEPKKKVSGHNHTMFCHVNCVNKVLEGRWPNCTH